MKKIFTLLCLSSLFVAKAQLPTINGDMADASYGAAIATTNANDCFGGNNVGSLYYYKDGTDICIGVTGNTDGYNKFVIFFDFSTYAGRPAGSTLNHINGGLDGAKLGGEVDFVVMGGEDPNGTDYYMNGYRFDANGAFPTMSTTITTDYFGNIQSQAGSLKSFNSAAVWGGTGNVIVAYNGGGGATQGLEMRIPLTAFPGVTTAQSLKLFVLLTGSGGYASNESIPGMTGFAGGCAMDDADMSAVTMFTGAVALSIDLTNFSAKSVAGATNLAWTTASEKDNAVFQIERSVNARDFSPIGEVKAAGNSNVAKNYTFTDAAPLSGVNYYRLKAVDNAGLASLSKVVAVNFSDKSNNPSVFPNPASDVSRVNVNASEASTMDIQVTDLTGRVLISQNVAVEKGANLLPLNISNLVSGAYLVKINGDFTRFVKF
jgi:hypothetical protein